MCDKCDSEEEEIGPCDYSIEVEGDYSDICNCCSDCRKLCYEDV